MDLSLTKVNVVNLFTEDLSSTKSFYAEVLGLPLVGEDQDSAVFRLENLMINLLDVAAAPELIAPASVASSDNGSRFTLVAFVKDVDAACSELGKRGVTLINGPADRPWGVRNACFADPAGHIWEIAQDLAKKG